MGTIPARLGSGRVGSGRLTCDYKAISVQLQLQLPTGTELGKSESRGERKLFLSRIISKLKSSEHKTNHSRNNLYILQ